MGMSDYPMEFSKRPPVTTPTVRTFKTKIKIDESFGPFYEKQIYSVPSIFLSPTVDTLANHFEKFLTKSLHRQKIVLQDEYPDFGLLTGLDATESLDDLIKQACYGVLATNALKVDENNFIAWRTHAIEKLDISSDATARSILKTYLDSGLTLVASYRKSPDSPPKLHRFEIEEIKDNSIIVQKPSGEFRALRFDRMDFIALYEGVQTGCEFKKITISFQHVNKEKYARCIIRVEEV